MYCTVQRNAETRSCNRCCSRKAISSYTVRQCVFVPFCTQHAMRARHIASCVYVFRQCMPVFMHSARYFGHISMKLEFSGKIFMKILPVGAELFHMDRQTEMTKLIITFRNFANAPEDTELCIIFQKSQKLI